MTFPGLWAYVVERRQSVCVWPNRKGKKLSELLSHGPRVGRAETKEASLTR